MTSIDKRPNGMYRARWRERPNGPQLTKTFARKLDAQRFLDLVAADIHTGRYITPTAGEITVAEFVARWSTGQPWRVTTRQSRETILARHILPTFGARRMKDVNRSDVQKWVTSLTAKLSPGTVRTYYRLLAQLMRSAVEDRVIHESPCRKIPLPAVVDEHVTPLTVDQVTRIANAVPARYRALVLVSAGLGLRQGEACGLTVDRVDFLRRTVTIDRQLVSVNGRPPSLGPTKTKRGNRVLPLPDLVGLELSRHLQEHPARTDGLIFATAAREPLNRTLWAMEFRNAADRAQVDATSHDLRHHCASLLIAAGCSVRAVSDFLGHKNAAETLNTYSHLWPSDDDRIRQSIERAWADRPGELSSISPQPVLRTTRFNEIC